MGGYTTLMVQSGDPSGGGAQNDLARLPQARRNDVEEESFARTTGTVDEGDLSVSGRD
jgi:hypothetical protein